MSEQSSNGKPTEIKLTGRIDSTNAPLLEDSFRSLLEGSSEAPVILDASDLEYISSAGLRLILRLRKRYPDLTIRNVCSEVYEVLEMTGFCEMMNVEKAYRVVSVEGAEEIGRGANGTIYRIDRDNVVKVYNNADALAEIQHEREVARKALVLGIPTAISYDVVKVGDSYGSVFELLRAKSFSKILAEEPEKMDWCVKEFVDLLKKIHSTVVPEDELPDMKETALKWAEFVKDYLPEDEGRKLLSLVQAVPKDQHMIHGDYHTKNVELVDDEVLLIDMDTLAVGNPIFELASIFNAFIGFSELNHEQVLAFQGFDYETSKTFWQKVLAAYLGTENEKIIRSVENKARIIGYTRLIRRSIRRGGLDDPQKKKDIDFWREKVIDLLKTTDTLTFRPNILTIDALKENLPEVIDFVNYHLENAECPMKEQMQIDMAAEEIFINIANYAYGDKTGSAEIKVDFDKDLSTMILTFSDSGTPYNPLAKQDPDVSLSAEERTIGGLGIFLVKKTMDDMTYEYIHGKNILHLIKKIH